MTINNIALSSAGPADAEAVFRLINVAYAVETGDSGVGFKRCERFVHVDEVSSMLQECTITKATDSQTGELLGVIAFKLFPGSHLYFGPFAVAPNAQGKGVGRLLRNHVESLARANDCKYLEIKVINVRDDILPMYRRDGFVEVGTQPYTEEWKVTRPVHFLVLHKAL